MNLMNTFGRQAAANGFHVLPIAWGQKFPATWTSNGWKPEAAWGRWSSTSRPISSSGTGRAIPIAR